MGWYVYISGSQQGVGVGLPSQEALAISGDILYRHDLGRGCLLLASDGYRTGMLLNIGQSTGSPHNKESSSQNVSSAKVDNHCCKAVRIIPGM